MALERTVTVISLPAAADLSAGQHRILETGTNGRVNFGSGSVAALVGVLGNKPGGTAHAAQVAIAGVVKLMAGGSITAGDWVKSNGNGFGLTTTTTGNSVIGRAQETVSGSGILFECSVTPGVI